VKLKGIDGGTEKCGYLMGRQPAPYGKSKLLSSGLNRGEA
jgi:hypothetical protein